MFVADARHEMAYQRRLSRHKAQYSLDCDDGIEYSACLHEDVYKRQFRESVLPLDPALEASLMSEGPRPDFKICPVCGGPVPPDRRQAYCSGLCKESPPPPATGIYAEKAGCIR